MDFTENDRGLGGVSVGRSLGVTTTSVVSRRSFLLVLSPSSLIGDPDGLGCDGILFRNQLSSELLCNFPCKRFF